MTTSDYLSTIYANARELVKQNNPQAARKYILVVLNSALKTYQTAPSIMVKAKTAAFMDKWIAVSRDLYDAGITDYVLECFGLPLPNRNARASSDDDAPRVIAPAAEPAPAPAPSVHGGLDLAGLVEEGNRTQGWCAELFAKNKTAVVEISAYGSSSTMNGTGFIISANGYLLTNDHVVYDTGSNFYCSKVVMKLFGEDKTYKVEVLFSDKKSDVALCRFDPSKVGHFTCVKRIEHYATLMQGADCLVIGNAFGRGLAPFTGVVRFTQDDEGDLVYTAPSNPGDSGAPVFNRIGECIGINKSRTLAFDDTEANGYANATPMSTVNALLAKWTSANHITL